MNLTTILLGIFAIVSTIISFYLEFSEANSKLKTYKEARAFFIKRILMFLSLALGLLAILIEVKDKIDSNSEAINRQTAILSNLAKVITNTDPITGSTLEIQWGCSDKLSFNALDTILKHYNDKHFKNTSGYNSWERTFIDTTSILSPPLTASLYVMDSADYVKNRHNLFTSNSSLVIQTDILKKVQKANLSPDHDDPYSAITRYDEDKDTEGFGRDTSIYSGELNFKLYSRIVNQELGFSNMANLYCIMAVQPHWRRIATRMGKVRLNNATKTKTIDFNFKMDTVFYDDGRPDLQIFVSRVNRLSIK